MTTLTKQSNESKTSSTLRKAIAIHRVSTDQQDLARQRTDLAIAKRVHQLQIERVLELDGVSGASMLSNRDVQSVLDSLTRPEIAGVVVSISSNLRWSDA